MVCSASKHEQARAHLDFHCTTLYYTKSGRYLLIVESIVSWPCALGDLLMNILGRPKVNSKERATSRHKHMCDGGLYGTLLVATA